MSQPFFSIVITTFNRAQIVGRCVRSCLAQTFTDFELLVVDDKSVDDTVEMLERIDDSRIRVISHDANRGINPSRYTGATNAAGQWIVVMDSDDELLPDALERLHVVIGALPDHVRVVRSRLQHDDGRVTPHFVPDGPYDYVGRIKWAEAEGGHDAARCLHRDAVAATPYIVGRRGAMETLFELNLAQKETSVCIPDVLGIVHSDAPNSWLRSSGIRQLVPRLFLEAPDMLWMALTTLELHGAALREHGPHQYARLLRIAATQSFLLQRRRDGIRYSFRSLLLRPADPFTWATLVLGLFGGRAVAVGTAAYRRFAIRR
jgi:glycosyltransferase involved in cell wall biosynthesis